MSELHYDRHCSAMGRMWRCPASARLEASLPFEPGDEGNEGTSLHGYVNRVRMKYPELTDEQQAAVESCWALIDEHTPQEGRTFREHPVALLDPGTGKVLVGGRVDWFAIDDRTKKGVVIDWKFWHREMNEKYALLQVIAYATAVMQMYALVEVYCVVWLPRLKRKYEVIIEHLDRATAKIRDVIRECERLDTVPKPDPDACRYCRALALCPEVYRQTLKVCPAPHLSIETMTTVGKALKAAKLMETWVKKVRDFARKCHLDGKRIPGWEFKEVAGARYIKDPNAAFSAMKPVLAPHEFMTAVTVSVPRLEDAYAKKMKELNPSLLVKEAKGEFERMMENAIERKEPTLRIEQVRDPRGRKPQRGKEDPDDDGDDEEAGDPPALGPGDGAGRGGSPDSDSQGVPEGS